jgi:hypothetical protein
MRGSRVKAETSQTEARQPTGVAELTAVLTATALSRLHECPDTSGYPRRVDGLVRGDRAQWPTGATGHVAVHATRFAAGQEATDDPSLA